MISGVVGEKQGLSTAPLGLLQIAVSSDMNCEMKLFVYVIGLRICS